MIREADVLVENFSPRVFENFGLTWDLVKSRNPGIVMVRMPAFGLDGPWRDNVGFAQTMEQMTGLAWVTGHEDDQPRIPKGPCDPLAGQSAAFAMLLGLERRRQSGQGSFIEVSMVESALNAAAEQVIEYTAHGIVLARAGNRSRDAAPQGLYACRGEESWLALSVADDEQWRALKGVLENPDWADDPALDSAAGRHQASAVRGEGDGMDGGQSAPDANLPSGRQVPEADGAIESRADQPFAVTGNRQASDQ